MGLGGKDHADAIAGPYVACCNDDAHDACLANQSALIVATQNCRHEPWLDAVKLPAGIAKPSDLNYRRPT
jgi:hypothetical protein